jgi:hypothetical protein
VATKAIKPTIRFAADFDAYKRELKRAIGLTDKFDRKLKGAGKRNNFRGIGKAALGAAAGIGAIAVAANELRTSVKATSDLAKATRQLQRATGLTAEEASQLAAVLQVRGIGTDKLGRSFTTLAKQIESAKTGSGAAAENFRKLGIAQDAIRDGDVSTILVQAADGFEKLGDGTSKAAIAQQLFGRNARDLIPLLEGGGQALRDQLGLAPKLSQEQVKQALAATIAQRNFNLALLNLRVTLGLAVLPYLSKAATALSTFITQVQTGTGLGGAFRDRILAISDAINGVISPLTRTNNRLVNFAAALTAVAAAFAAGKVIASVVGLGSALAAVFSNPYLAAAAAIAAVIAGIGAAAFVAYKKSKPFRDLIDNIGRTLRPVFRSLGESAKKELPKISKEFGRLIKDFATLARELRPVVVPIIKVWVAFEITLIRGIAPALSIAAKAMRGATTVIRAMASAMRSIVKVAGDFRRAISTAFGQALDPINAVIRAIRTLLSEARKLPGVSALGAILNQVAPGRRSVPMGARAGASAAGRAASPPVARSAISIESNSSPGLVQQRITELEKSIETYENALAKVEDRTDKAGKRAKQQFKEKLADLRYELSNLERRQQGESAIEGILQRIADLRIQAARAAADELGTSLNQREAERARLRNLAAAADFTREQARLSAEASNADGGYVSQRADLVAQRNMAGTEATDPRVQARFAREREKAQRDLARAEARGDLDAKDAALAQLAALEDRYGAGRVARLQAEIDELDRLEQERKDNAQRALDELRLSEQERIDALKGEAIEAANTAAAVGALSTGLAGMAATVLGFLRVAGKPSAEASGPQFNSPGSVQDFLSALLGIGFSLDTGEVPLFGGQPSGAKKPTIPKKPKRKSKGRASGGLIAMRPGALTLVGETGPELLMSNGQVISGSRTQRMGSAGGVTLNVYPRTSADDPTELARALGWQLATR